MTAQPEHPAQDDPIIARPERSPAALRVALAQVAPHRLSEMERQKDEVIALAARSGQLGPITQFLDTWAAVIEIARFPATAARLRAAEHAAQNLDRHDPSWQQAMADIRSLADQALTCPFARFQAAAELPGTSEGLSVGPSNQDSMVARPRAPACGMK